MGLNGLSIFKKKSVVLTHCNTGKLATGGDGTAFSVVKSAFENGLVSFVYADETRPRGQGARLTAWELKNENVPHVIIADNAGAHLMSQGKVDMMIVGSDRIAANGDVAVQVQVGGEISVGSLDEPVDQRLERLPGDEVGDEIDPGLHGELRDRQYEH